MFDAPHKSRIFALVKGKVLTMDGSDTIAEAILVKGDRIAAVGSEAEISERLPRGAPCMDLGGRTVIPGMVDSHAHLELTVSHMMHAAQVHTPPLESLEQIFNVLREHVRVVPKGEWIFARGSFQMQKKVREGRLPTRMELDEIAPEHPMAVFTGFHIGVFNTRALDRMGWFHETRVPPGSSLGRDPKTGDLTGVVTEVWDKLPFIPWGYEQLVKDIREGALKYWVSRGFTSVHELPYNTEGVRAWQALRRSGDLPLRVRLYLHHPKVIDLGAFVRSGIEADFGDPWLSIGGVKIFADGTATHANLHPVEDIKWTQEELDEMILEAHRAGLHIWTHVLTRKGTRMALASYRRALERYPCPDHRHRLEHAGDFITDEESLGEMAELGVVPVSTPQFISAMRDRGGPRLRDLIDRGFILPGNTDSTGTQPESPDPWHSIWCCVERRNFRGEVVGKDQRLSPMEAIRMFTLWAAWGGFEDHIKGSIEPGKLADLVVLGADPLTVPADGLKEMPVDLVLVGGEVKWSASGNDCLG